MLNESVIIRCKSCKTLNRVPINKLQAQPVCGQCKTLLDVPRDPIHVTSASYDQQVHDWPEFLLAEFWAKWCGYCRMMEPFITELAKKRAGRLKIIKIDVDAEPDLSRRFTIKATPTFILYHNGVQINRFDGAPRQNIVLEDWLDQNLFRSFSK